MRGAYARPGDHISSKRGRAGAGGIMGVSSVESAESCARSGSSVAASVKCQVKNDRCGGQRRWIFFSLVVNVSSYAVWYLARVHTHSHSVASRAQGSSAHHVDHHHALSDDLQERCRRCRLRRTGLSRDSARISRAPSGLTPPSCAATSATSRGAQ